jgi:hypothetical protein
MEASKSNKNKKVSEINIYEQRFFMLMKLIRIDKMLKSAKIIHQKSK